MIDRRLMAQTPTVSIIIPVRNRSDLLQRCLQSVRAQDYDSCEVIVVDDGSTERRVKPVDADLFISNGVHAGPAYARNVGALRSRGQLLLFLDSDTELRGGTLARLPALFMDDPSIGALGGSGQPDPSGGDVQYISGKSYDALGRCVTTHYRPSDQGTGLHDCDHIEAAFLCIRRDAFERVGGFDPDWGYMGEDRDLCLRLKDARYRVVACLDTRAIHHCLGGTDYDSRSKDFTTFFYEKCLQVAIKRGGLQGGILWSIGNYREWLRPSRVVHLAGAFRQYRGLVARRAKDHLAPERMTSFYGTKAAETLDRALPFKVRYPLKTPRNLVLFVNAICNALCDHCFIIHDELPKQDRRQIPLEQLLRIVRSLNAPVSLSMTGGEPFMRKDLGTLLRECMALPMTRDLTVFSNGSMPRHIDTVCRDVLGATNKPLQLQLSLDGLEERHDEIRKIPKGFQRMLETCDHAARLHREVSRFSFIVAITVMRQNLAEIEPLIDELERLGFPSKLSIVRGNDFSTFGVPADILDGEYNPNTEVAVDVPETEQMLQRVEARHPRYFGSQQRLKLKVMLDTLSTKRRQLPCYAGYEDAVVHNDGSVGICEQVTPFGNLADWNWSFEAAWNSAEAMEHRLKLTACACIHGCNVSTSVGLHAAAQHPLERLRRLIGSARP